MVSGLRFFCKPPKYQFQERKGWQKRPQAGGGFTKQAPVHLCNGWLHGPLSSQIQQGSDTLEVGMAYGTCPGGQGLLGWCQAGQPSHLSTSAGVFQDPTLIRLDKSGEGGTTAGHSYSGRRLQHIFVSDTVSCDACGHQNGTAGRPEARRGQSDKPVSRLRLVAHNTWHCRQCVTFVHGKRPPPPPPPPEEKTTSWEADGLDKSISCVHMHVALAFFLGRLLDFGFDGMCASRFTETLASLDSACMIVAMSTCMSSPVFACSTHTPRSYLRDGSASLPGPWSSMSEATST